ncbi:hypothetical protein [Streptomyces sp. ME19-01-6]|uniref:hypothetical protein n=1 Tax=Streptomyces sp. ME19-01-6 TaxID=3028686 RepID=UPI0029B0728C|nr:hypothetical protein [Streptomyces sp. ME19-01-6]MDX3232563.1 hypothetical protein [Streptomyces sp. ME19-01-6]
MPARLIALQQTADAEHANLTGLIGDEHRAQWKCWFDAAVESQAAITKHAEDAGLNRFELEAAVKKAVRHPDPKD